MKRWILSPLALVFALSTVACTAVVDSRGHSAIILHPAPVLVIDQKDNGRHHKKHHDEDEDDD